MSLKSHLLLCVVVTLTRGIFCEDHFFDDFYKCKQGPTFNDCITKAMNTVFPKLKDGKPEYGIQSLNPMLVDQIKYDQKSEGAIQLSQEFNNISVYNFATDTKFSSINLDLQKKTVNVEFSNPLIKMTGTLKLSGKILLLPLKGQGKYTAEFPDFHGKLILKYKNVRRDGKTYFRFTQIETLLDPRGFSVQTENLVDGQPEITEQLNKLLNDNWKDFWVEIEPSYAKGIGKVILDLLNKAFAHIPVDPIINS